MSQDMTLNSGTTDLFATQAIISDTPDYSDLVENLTSIDPDNISAREALDELYRLKELLKQ